MPEAVIDINSSGDNTIVTAVTGYRVIIDKLLIIATGAVAVTLKTGSTNLTGAMFFAASQELKLFKDADPWFTCNTSEAFIINLGAAVQVGGTIIYKLRKLS